MPNWPWPKTTDRIPRRGVAVAVAGLAPLASCSDDGTRAQGSSDDGQDLVADPAEDDGCLDDPAAISLINGVVLTVDATDSQASSVLVEGSRVTEVGDSITAPDGACVIDLEGRTVVPGIVDSHVHFTRDWVRPGHFLSEIENARSTQDVLDAIAERVESVPDGEYITVVGGYPTNAFALPTLAELDEVAPAHPVYLQASFSGPSAVNSAAKSHLEANGHDTIAADGSIPVGGGGPTAPSAAIQILQGEQTGADAERAAMEYMTWANSMGITTVVDVPGGGGGIEMAYQVWESDDLSVRIRLRYGGLGAIEATLQAVDAGIERVGEGDDMMRVVGVGEFSVGGFGDTTSDFASGWSEVASRGLPLAQHSLRAAEHEAHISAFEAVDATTPLADLHWSLDHANEVTPEQLSRLADLGVGVGVHNFAYYGSFGGGAPFRDIIDAGVTAGGGSDGRAIGPVDPWQGIHFMVTGLDLSGSLVNDGQQITRLEALRMYTMGSAWTALEEDELGSIEVGKLADLVVLDADFLEVPDDEIDDIAAVLTLVGGEVVYDDSSLGLG